MSIALPLALDAMGGDKAPDAVVHGARIALKDYPNLKFVFFGDESKVRPLVHKYKLEDHCEIIHTEHAIQMHDKPSQAVRQGRKSSMRMAIDAVNEGRACAAVSSGNTGALMAMSKIVFKTLPGIGRPAITAVMPAQNRNVVLLDMGANIVCEPADLVQFAIMGDAYARVVLNLSRPKIGLLNVGAEEMKGHEVVQGAHQLLRGDPNLQMDYHGFVEGNDILEGTVDVVVTDGFTGNIALKTAEGAGRLIYRSIKSAIENSIWAKIGFLFAKPALMMAMKKLDPRNYNGAILLGLNGIAVKSHGGSDAKGFASAIRLAAKLVEEQINNKIIEELTQTGITAALTSRFENEPAARLVSESIN